MTTPKEHLTMNDNQALNGAALDRLTPALIEQLQITLDITTEPEEPTT